MNPDPERLARMEFSAALETHCRAEAERTWLEIETRLGAPRQRHDDFVRDLTANLLRKMDRKTRDSIWRNLLRRTTGNHHPRHNGMPEPAIRAVTPSPTR